MSINLSFKLESVIGKYSKAFLRLPFILVKGEIKQIEDFKILEWQYLRA